MEYIDQQFIFDNSPIREIISLDELGSTNHLAKQLFRNNEITTPGLIVTERQIAGKGQRENRWWSGEGSLTFSIVFSEAEPTTSGLLSMAAANAVANSIMTLVDSLSVYTKWPNDVFVGSKKVSGILIESVRKEKSLGIIVGIGINSNCSMQTSPAEVQAIATSIFDESGTTVDHPELIAKTSRYLFESMNTCRESARRVIAEFEAKSLFPINSDLRVELANGQVITGKFCGYGGRGELMLESDSNVLRLASARIQSFNASKS